MRWTACATASACARYGQRDPLIEYKAEAFKIFEELMVNIKTEICHNIFRSASSLMAFENFLRNVPQADRASIHQRFWRFDSSATGATSTALDWPVGSDMVSEANEAVSQSPSRFAAARKWAATIPAPAAAARNTSSAAGNKLFRALQAFKASLASATPAAGRPYSLAVTRESAMS